MNRRLVAAAALSLALPALALAQPSRHDRRDRHRDRGGARVEFRVSIGSPRVPVRVLPSPHTPVVRRYSPGGQFTILATRGDYYLVDMGHGRSGWVHRSSLPGYVHRSTVTTVIVREPLITTTTHYGSSARIAALSRFDYSRVLEWSGNHEQGRLRLVRQADGNYLASVESESIAPRQARVSPSALSELLSALERMQAFPDRSFAEDGAHFYTTLSAEGTLSNGRALHFSRRFYDPSDGRSARLAGDLDAAVGRLIARIEAAVPPTSGLVSTFR